MSNHITKATFGEKQTIHSLWKPYIDELINSYYKSQDYKDEDEVYHYPWLDNYWQEETKFPYLILSGKEVAGFALVSYDRDYWRITEFYILPKFRRLGVAFDCATEIFRKYPGNWEISFNKHNFPSRSLWQKVADNLSKGVISTGQTSSSHDYIRFSV
jgi:predicted acetyltransferase